MKLAALAEALVAVSAKAARIARTMRSEHALFELLVEEKTGDSKNKRFVQDFKTLGDVLVQETVRHDVAKQFSGLSDHIYGEESNAFTNTLGESVTLSIQPSQQETCHILEKVLDGNTEAARLLAEVVHSNTPAETCPELETVTEEIDVNDLGIWIDPIDSTAQYISGLEGVTKGGIHEEGLQCVVVIIGVYQRSTGCPVFGVCQQPFYQQDSSTGKWKGRCLWGLSHGEAQVCRVPKDIGTSTSVDIGTPTDGVCLVTSSSEQSTVQEQLSKKYTVRHAAGAGYKLLCVVDNRAAGYVLSAGSTYKWDTCGPHAILQALGGDVLSYSEAREQLLSVIADKEQLLQATPSCRVRYAESDPGSRPEGEKWSNASGLIAYVDPQHLAGIIQALNS